MLEYLNTTALWFMAVFFIILIVIYRTSENKSKIMPVLVLFLTSLLFYEAYDKYDDAQTNIKAFNKNTTLKCYSGGGLYATSNVYKVSKYEGWSLSKRYFTKDSIAVEAFKCEVW